MRNTTFLNMREKDNMSSHSQHTTKHRSHSVSSNEKGVPSEVHKLSQIANVEDSASPPSPFTTIPTSTRNRRQFNRGQTLQIIRNICPNLERERRQSEESNTITRENRLIAPINRNRRTALLLDIPKPILGQGRDSLAPGSAHSVARNTLVALHAKHRSSKEVEICAAANENAKDNSELGGSSKPKYLPANIGQAAIDASMMQKPKSPDQSKEFDKIKSAEQFLEKVLEQLQEKAQDEPELKYLKAVEFFRDAFYGRKIRYTFKRIFQFQTNPNWITLIALLCWLYMFLTFFEPSHSTSRPFEPGDTKFNVVVSLEALFIFIFIIDDILEIIHRSQDIERSFKGHFLLNMKFIFKIIIELSLVIDFCLFWGIYTLGFSYFRFARILRPFKLVLHSKEVRRHFKAIVKTIPYIFDVIILFFLITFVFAILGMKILEDAQDETSFTINEENNFRTLGHAINTLWMLITLSNYPDVVRPYVDNSIYYFFYFLPYIFMVLVIFIPIPVAVVFDAFRRNRGELLLKDRIREKEALFATFCSLDIQNQGYIELEQWNGLMTHLQMKKKEEDINSEAIKVIEEKTNKIYYLFYDVEEGVMNLYQFFEACQVAFLMKDLGITVVCDPKCWFLFRKFCNEKLKIRRIVTSTAFEIFIFFIVLINILILILYATLHDEETQNTLDIIDNVLLYIFVTEAVLKLIGLGITEYFDDNWNKFDFTLVCMSLFMNVTLSFMKVGKSAKSAKAAKAARLSKSQRAARILKGLKSVRAMRILTASAGTFIRIKKMIHNTVICMPTVKKLITIIFIIFYFYTMIGLEVYHPANGDDKETRYNKGFYGDFSSFERGLLGLFQIMTQSGWHNILFHYATTHNYGGAVVFFYSFHLLVVVILLSLIVGLVWEVFTILDPDSMIDDYTRNEDQKTNSEEGSKSGSMDESRSNTEHTHKSDIFMDNSTFPIILENTEGESSPIRGKIQQKSQFSRGAHNLESFEHSIDQECSDGSSVASPLHHPIEIDIDDELDMDKKKETSHGIKKYQSLNQQKDLQSLFKTSSAFKSDFFLQKALLKGADNTKLMAREEQELKKQFRGKYSRVIKEEEIKALSLESRVGPEILLKKTLRVVRNQYDLRVFVDKLNKLFTKLEELTPPGSIIRLAYENDEKMNNSNYSWFLPYFEGDEIYSPKMITFKMHNTHIIKHIKKQTKIRRQHGKQLISIEKYIQNGIGKIEGDNENLFEIDENFLNGLREIQTNENFNSGRMLRPIVSIDENKLWNLHVIKLEIEGTNINSDINYENNSEITLSADDGNFEATSSSFCSISLTDNKLDSNRSDLEEGKAESVHTENNMKIEEVTIEMKTLEEEKHLEITPDIHKMYSEQISSTLFIEAECEGELPTQRIGFPSNLVRPVINENTSRIMQNSNKTLEMTGSSIQLVNSTSFTKSGEYSGVQPSVPTNKATSEKYLNFHNISKILQTNTKNGDNSEFKSTPKPITLEIPVARHSRKKSSPEIPTEKQSRKNSTTTVKAEQKKVPGGFLICLLPQKGESRNRRKTQTLTGISGLRRMQTQGLQSAQSLQSNITPQNNQEAALNTNEILEIIQDFGAIFTHFNRKLFEMMKIFAGEAKENIQVRSPSKNTRSSKILPNSGII